MFTIRGPVSDGKHILFPKLSDVPLTNISPSPPPEEISQLSIYEPTDLELLSAATSPESLIGTWTHNLLTLAWIPWRNDDDLYGMQTLDPEEESRLADPEKWRQELIACNGPTTINDLEGYVFLSPLTPSTIN